MRHEPWCPDNDAQHEFGNVTLEETLQSEPNTLERLRELADVQAGPYRSLVNWLGHFDNACRELVEGHGYDYDDRGPK